MCALQGGRRRHDHGLLHPRRPDDGHALRLARSRRAALPHAAKGMTADAIADLLYKRVRPPRPVRRVARLARDRGGDARGARRHRLFRPPHRPRDRRPHGDAGGLDGSSSPAASASTPGKCARRSSPAWNGWASISTSEANRASAQIISAKSSPTIVFVLETDEERMIAEHTLRTAGLADTKAATGFGEIIAEADGRERRPSRRDRKSILVASRRAPLEISPQPQFSLLSPANRGTRASPHAYLTHGNS